MNTSDRSRNVRAETYERVRAALGPAYPIEEVDADALEGQADVMFEFTGVAQVASMREQQLPRRRDRRPPDVVSAACSSASARRARSNG